MTLNKTFKKNFNILISLTISICVISFLGLIALLSNMHPSTIFDNPTYKHLKYYSVILALLVFIFYLIFSILLILNKNNKFNGLNRTLNVINLALVSNETINFLFTIFYLMIRIGGNQDYHFSFVITGSNLIFNVIVPILCFIQFAFVLKDSKVKYIDSLFGLIPVAIYGLIYIILCNLHKNGGTISNTYDWYYFCNHNIAYMYVAFVTLLAGTYGIGNLLVLLNKQPTMSSNMAKLSCHILLFVFASIGIAWMLYYGFTDDDPAYTPVERILKRFTGVSNLSNIFVLFTSVIGIVLYSLVISKKIKDVPYWYHILLLTVVVFIMMVFLTEAFSAFYHLATSNFETAKATIWRRLYRKHLIFLHFLTPVTSLKIFIFVMHKDIKLKHCFISASLLGAYALIYTIVLYCHINDTWHEGIIWDQYNLLKVLNYKSVWIAPIVGYGIGFGLSVLFRLISQKVNNFYLKNNKKIVWKKCRI